MFTSQERPVRMKKLPAGPVTVELVMQQFVNKRHRDANRLKFTVIGRETFKCRQIEIIHEQKVMVQVH